MMQAVTAHSHSCRPLGSPKAWISQCGERLYQQQREREREEESERVRE